MTLLATDGLEYADFTQRLLGRPLDNPRNKKLNALKTDYPHGEVQAFFKAYDKARGQHLDKEKSGWYALADHRRKTDKVNGTDTRPSRKS